MSTPIHPFAARLGGMVILALCAVALIGCHHNTDVSTVQPVVPAVTPVVPSNPAPPITTPPPVAAAPVTPAPVAAPPVVMDATWTIRISGTIPGGSCVDGVGMQYKGSYLITNAHGTTGKSFEGEIPGQYVLTGQSISVTLQSGEKNGHEQVDILKNGVVVQSTTTQGAYGSVTLAAQ